MKELKTTVSLAINGMGPVVSLSNLAQLHTGEE
jgi:hypothetical protein